VNEPTLQLYFGNRCAKGQTRTTFVDVDAQDPSRVIYVYDKPVVDLGKLGAFDDSGANVSCVVRVGERV
jgi:hypothetical protein